MPDFSTPYAPAAAENGKFAILTTAELSALGMSTAALSATIGRFALLTYSVGNGGTTIVTPTPPSVVDVKSLTLTISGAVSAIAFAAPSRVIEIQNRSNSNVFLYWSNPTTYATIASAGLVIASSAYYSFEQQASSIWLASDGNSVDIRIMNHY